jgi:hypothetical protein
MNISININNLIRLLSGISISKLLRDTNCCVPALGENSSGALSALRKTKSFLPFHILNNIILNYQFQSSVVFDLLKAHLKRAPSLRGAALVRLASLKFQAEPWPLLANKTEALARLEEVRCSAQEKKKEKLRRLIHTPS